MYIAIGLGSFCLLLSIIIFFILWKANYCNVCCCKKIRFYYEVRQHLRAQAQSQSQQTLHGRENPIGPEQQNLMGDHNFVEIPLNEETERQLDLPRQPKKPCWFCCLCFRKKQL